MDTVNIHLLLVISKLIPWILFTFIYCCLFSKLVYIDTVYIHLLLVISKLVSMDTVYSILNFYFTK